MRVVEASGKLESSDERSSSRDNFIFPKF